MAKEIFKILGQVKPAAATEEVLYTVPQNRSAIVKVTGFNENAGAAAVKLAIVPNGGQTVPPPTVPANYNVNGLVLNAKTHTAAGELKGITLDEFDQIRVESDNADCVFQCFGVELEP